ncbi:MAG: glycosyltransferase [Candidatus Aureabacteria bacterium]|nr:glycosyltransferase [Candidatus Auribacterota bacterium]
MKKIRIAQIIYGLKLAGAEKIVLSLATRIPHDRFETVVVTLTADGALEKPLRDAGVKVVYVPKFTRYDATVLYRLARTLRREGVDIAHTHLFTADSWGRVAAAMARVPLVVSTLHAVDLWLSPLQLSVEKWTSRLAHRLIAVSRAVKDFYISKVGIPPEKISVVCNGIDGSRLPAVVEREGKLRQLGVSPKSLLVGVAARLEEQKDLFTWLRAARIAAGERPDLEFVIAGEGSQREALEEFSRSIGMEQKVHFLGAREDVEEIIAVCDLIMFSSRFEGLSLAMLESMASGKAVIAGRMGETAEIIQHGENGLLTPAGDERELSRAMLSLLKNEGERRRLGEAARKTVMERFSLERMIEGTVQIYEEGLSRRRAAAIKSQILPRPRKGSRDENP